MAPRANSKTRIPVLIGRLVKEEASRLSGFKLEANSLPVGVAHVAVWCPWCQSVHRHGLEGGGTGHVTAHCVNDRCSPLKCTGYEIELGQDVATEADVVPAGLLSRDRRLLDIMSRATGAFRAVLLGSLLAVPKVRGQIVRKAMRRGVVTVFGWDAWRIEERGAEPIDGVGLVDLAARLHGVSLGVAAVRLLEAVAGDRLGPRTALAIQAAIDGGLARSGSAWRDERPSWKDLP